MSSDDNILQEMYEYQLMYNNSGEEYVVRGAEVKCTCSQQSCVLNLPEGYGYVTNNGMPRIVETDTSTDNIKGFGTCSGLNGEKCSPELGTWQGVSENDLIRVYTGKAGDSVYVTCDARTVAKDATAYCTKGKGTVSFLTSGQVIPDYKDVELVDRIIVLDKQDSYSRSEDNGKDFIGKIKVQEPGVYNLGISVSNRDLYNGGTVFVYDEKGIINKTLRYIGAYDFMNHEGEEREGFCEKTEYWTIWVDLVLMRKKNYYVEIDCPNVDSFKYKLIVNQEHAQLIGNAPVAAKQTLSGIWILAPNFKDDYPKIYNAVRKEKKNGVTTAILYLTDIYIEVFRRLLEAELKKNRAPISKETVTNRLSMLSLALSEFTQISIALSIASLVISNLPKSRIEKIIDSLAEGLDPIIVKIYDDMPTSEDTTYSMEKPYIDFHENYPLEFLEFETYDKEKKIDIYGESYEKGKLITFCGFNTVKTSYSEVVESVQAEIDLMY